MSLYGFNGQEKVDEVAGEGNHNTAMFWEYDTRTGRRWNLDPNPQISISDYAVFGNNPILNNDPDGDTYLHYLIGRLKYNKEWKVFKNSSNQKMSERDHFYLDRRTIINARMKLETYVQVKKEVNKTHRIINHINLPENLYDALESIIKTKINSIDKIDEKALDATSAMLTDEQYIQKGEEFKMLDDFQDDLHQDAISLYKGIRRIQKIESKIEKLKSKVSNDLYNNKNSEKIKKLEHKKNDVQYDLKLKTEAIKGKVQPNKT